MSNAQTDKEFHHFDSDFRVGRVDSGSGVHGTTLAQTSGVAGSLGCAEKHKTGAFPQLPAFVLSS